MKGKTKCENGVVWGSQDHEVTRYSANQ